MLKKLLHRHDAPAVLRILDRLVLAVLAYAEDQPVAALLISAGAVAAKVSGQHNRNPNQLWSEPPTAAIWYTVMGGAGSQFTIVL